MTHPYLGSSDVDFGSTYDEKNRSVRGAASTGTFR